MEWLNTLYEWVWGAPLLILVMGVGLFYTFILRAIQFRELPYALKLVISPGTDKDTGDISNFASLMTALAASVGIGNIAGVATAVTVGGLGAIFWMWVTALIGMATKYAEALLAVKYREVDSKGEMCGGPMYFIEKGLGWKWLAITFAGFGSIVSLCGGNILQANSVADAMHSVLHVSPLVSGIILACFIGFTLFGGIKSISRVSSFLVPFKGTLYIGCGIVILIICYDKIPGVVAAIVQEAFTGKAAFGGFIGSSMLLAMQVGISRGVMTSEAGLGTASIVAAAARTDHPARQALVSMTGCFLGTCLMCTVTGLVLGVTGVLDHAEKGIQGASLTAKAFNSVIPGGGFIVTICIILFGVTTQIGWAYYGEKCMEYLFGRKVVVPFRIVFTLVVVLGAVMSLEVVWKVSDIANGLMAYPNLIGLFALSGVVMSETRSFFKILAEERATAKEAVATSKL